MDVTIGDIERLIAKELGRRTVSPEDRLIEDLGADSLEVVSIIAAIEERYQIRIEEAELPDLSTVGELYACVRDRVAG